MNFKKIESIFLVAFLLLNIYLLIGYWNRYANQYDTTAPDQINLIQEMEQEGIVLPEFAEEERSVYSMQADAHSLLEENADSLEGQAGNLQANNLIYQSILSEPIEFEGDWEEGFTEADHQRINDFINGPLVMFGEEYRYGRSEPENSRVIYYQYIEDISVADGTSEIVLNIDSDGSLVSYEQTYAGSMTEQGSSIGIITDRQAIEILFENNELSANSEIESIQLSYHRSLYIENVLSMYRPIWLVNSIGADGSRLLRVDAIDGSVVSELVIIEEEPDDPEESDEDDENDDSNDDESE